MEEDFNMSTPGVKVGVSEEEKRHYFIGYKYNFYVMQKCAIV